MNSITTFAATALVLFAIGQGIAAVRADEVPQKVLSTGLVNPPFNPQKHQSGFVGMPQGVNPIAGAERRWLRH